MKRRRWKLIGLGVGVILLAFLYYQWQAAIKRNRSIPDPPLHIAGNLYSVGSTGVTSFLLTGPDGHILIDGGYPETAPLIIGSIRKLGFDIKDVKVLLNTHAHFDHAGGLKELQDSSGAQLWISEQDAPIVLRTYGIVAQILRDLGVTRMRVLSAPKQMHGISAFGLEVVGYVD